MNASKNKGKCYEREVAKHLSKVTELNFERVPSSGSFVGGANSFRNDKLSREQINLFEGDIITPKEWDHVRIECKWYKDFCWHQLFDPSGERVLNTWIKQAQQGTKPLWFLCFKINRCGDYVVFDSKYTHMLKTPLHKFEYNPVENLNFVFSHSLIITSKDLFFEMNKDTILVIGDNYAKPATQEK